MTHNDASLLTRKAVPLVHSKEPIGSDCDDSRRAQAGLGVGGHVSDRGVGRELQDHDDVLLGLVREHQGTLQEEILLSGRDKTQIHKKEKTKKGKRERVQEKRKTTPRQVASRHTASRKAHRNTDLEMLVFHVCHWVEFFVNWVRIH